MAQVYLFLKWVHILAIISWMAGILYGIRLHINHVERGQDSEDVHDVLSLMERRLYKVITVPAMLVAFAAGLGITAINPSLWSQPWFLVKFVSAILLAGVTGYAGKLNRLFADRQAVKPASKTLRILNEVPTLLMAIIVWMVIFRPWS